MGELPSRLIDPEACVQGETRAAECWQVPFEEFRRLDLQKREEKTAAAGDPRVGGAPS